MWFLSAFILFWHNASHHGRTNKPKQRPCISQPPPKIRLDSWMQLLKPHFKKKNQLLELFLSSKEGTKGKNRYFFVKRNYRLHVRVYFCLSSNPKYMSDYPFLYKLDRNQKKSQVSLVLPNKMKPEKKKKNNTKNTLLYFLFPFFSAPFLSNLSIPFFTEEKTSALSLLFPQPKSQPWESKAFRRPNATSFSPL